MTEARRVVTLADVGARAGVDPSVVSRMLNGDPRLQIRPATRRRVLEAVEAMGYRRNMAARSLRTAQSGVYGLFIPDFDNPIYAQIITGAEKQAASLGRLLLTGSVAEAGADDYLERFGSGRIDGLLIAGASSGSILPRLEAEGLPWLFLNRRSPEARRFVILDDEGAVGLAVDHLTRLGHEHLAYISGPPSADTAIRRRTGYLRAVRSASLPLSEEDVVAADYTSAGGAAAMRHILEGGREVTAVVVANVASAVGALWAARGAGYEIPGDISIVAIHDLALANYLIPSLSTVRMPLEELGRRGVELLTSMSRTEPIEEVVTGPMELVLRASTGPPPR